MDIGCGLGDWVVWLKGVKKCDVAAVNLTEAQARVVRERGVDCTGSAWQLLAADETPHAKAFWGKYEGHVDVVTCWDTIEVRGVGGGAQVVWECACVCVCVCVFVCIH